eukprot:UN25978
MFFLIPLHLSTDNLTVTNIHKKVGTIGTMFLQKFMA